MTAIEKKHELSRYRIKQAEESLDEAKFLFAGKKSPRSDISKLYRDFYQDLRRSKK